VPAVVGPHPGREHVDDVTVGPLNTALGLGMAGFAVDQNQFGPQHLQLSNDL